MVFSKICSFTILYPPPCPCRASTAPPHDVARSERSLGRRRRDSPQPSLPEDLLIPGIDEGRKNMSTGDPPHKLNVWVSGPRDKSKDSLPDSRCLVDEPVGKQKNHRSDAAHPGRKYGKTSEDREIQGARWLQACKSKQSMKTCNIMQLKTYMCHQKKGRKRIGLQNAGGVGLGNLIRFRKLDCSPKHPANS